MRLRFLFSLLIGFSFTILTYGQEFNVKVDINSPASQSVDASLYKALKKNIDEFYNNTKWTEDEFNDDEKIDAQITISVVKEIGANNFTADILIQSRRPVYKSTYHTTMINYLDKGINITYTPGQPIQKSDVSYYDNLSSILTYYGYIILGLDYDSFSPLGGEEYFQKAFEILSTLPSSVANSSGWRQSAGVVGRNRYWLIENLLHNKVRPFRQFWYEYHRLGLDGLHEDADRQRAIIASGISGLQSVINSYPSTMTLQMFSDAKREEIVDVFKIADRGQKKKVYDIMVQCDPAQADKYKSLSR